MGAWDAELKVESGRDWRVTILGGDSVAGGACVDRLLGGGGWALQGVAAGSSMPGSPFQPAVSSQGCPWQGAVTWGP